MSRRLNRRRFLQSSAAASLGLAGLPFIRAEEKKLSANDKLRVGVIGVAGRGEGNWKDLQSAGAEIVAGCDVDASRIGKFRDTFPKAAFYSDFRKLIDAKGLDAVLVATPDHMHASPTLMALRAGLHVYCEKPLTHTVAEARLVAETAAKHNRVTQMGTQVHASNNYRRVVELIQSGVIGKVSEVHTFVGTTYNGDGKRPEAQPVPETLDWDLWLGAAPERPYNKIYVPFHWRRFWDFGGGALNDMACHHMDLPFWALKLRHPTKVTAEGSPPTPETTAEWLTVRYEFPGVNLTWYDGGKQPKLLTDLKVKWGTGSLFVGDKGMLLADYSKHALLVDGKLTEAPATKPFIANSIGHHKEWIEACKTGGPTTCNFDYSGALTECVLLGTVSYRSGKSFEWDAANLKTKGASEAQKFVSKEYRKGWEVA